MTSTVKQLFRAHAARALRGLADAMTRNSLARLLGRAEQRWAAVAETLYWASGKVAGCGCTDSDPEGCAADAGGEYCECHCHGPLVDGGGT